jgi:hypothetical protein
MANVKAEVQDNGRTLVLKVDLTQKGELSKTGKSHLVGTSNGFAKVDGISDVSYSLNVCKRVS